MPAPLRVLVLLVLLGLAAVPVAQAQRVVVNGERLSEADVAALEARYGVQAQEGRYWYDRASGAWGPAGGPTAGFLPAGLPVGGPLRADASAGTTGVYVNGRRLPVADVVALQHLVGTVRPGRYWLDAHGNVGYEGGPALLNLAVLAHARQQSTFYRSGTTDVGAGSSGGTSYVMGRDWSVIID